ncbi:sigma-E processing peptidase SpoIIGA [Cohnella panacarvi]|uniref:sigma-E processing peptidase SpoIIGA n=1 Tax=Cohnella panacarvi TaxID=400776 RepID=UPI00047DD1EB|nr:sigma-E processing peptidase SpoIIGA [Cohnella panacarvi]
MVVYVDLVFFTNLAVDGIVLLLTAKARRLYPARAKLIGAAVFGALYAASMFVTDIPYAYSFAGKVIVSLVMVLITFGYGGPMQLLRNAGAFYTVSFATLGGVIGLTYLVKSSGTSWAGMSFTQDGGIVVRWPMQLGLIAVAFLLSAWLFHGTGETRRKRYDVEALIWDVEVRIEGRSWTVRGLLDTGNRLYEPLTRTPVMIMEASVWKDLLPAGWTDRLKGESADRLIAELGTSGSEPYQWSHRLRLIPYRAVNGSPKLMLGIKPDAVILSRPEQSPLTTERVLIGLDGGTLSSDASYRAIVHPDLPQAKGAAPAPSQPA